MKKGKTISVERDIGRRTYSAPAKAKWSEEVGRFGIPAGELRRAELAIAVQVAERAAASGEGFAWMRKALGLTGKELGEILGVRLETISRWERGDVEVTRTAWLYVGGAVLEKAGRKPSLIERGVRFAADAK